MTIGILTEKPSAARNFATAFGGMTGTVDGKDYVIAHARGHLYEFVAPHEMVPEHLHERYRRWELEHLPWDPAKMDFRLAPIEKAGPVISELRQRLGACTEIVIATDVDPTGEGGMIAVNALLELGLSPSGGFSRMYFTDEAPASLTKGLADRRPVPSLTGLDEYRKATYRSKFDLLSMQFTRIATNMARESGQDVVLRQGRLKSAMVSLVGDQLKAHEDYVKKPFFQNRFRDENQVVYTDPEEPKVASADQVEQTYSPSSVVLDSRTDKATRPPRLLDLAALSSMLVDKGVGAKLTLATYQKMYEAQIVSYPRTEDTTITPEQFAELSPKIDQIADLVGVDSGLLTHREPRSSHVKAAGAHGANRPGPKVPASLEDLEQKFGTAGRLIYTTLAKSYLAMLAEDYRYEQQKGHVEKYPTFLGVANVPVSMGWRAVFDPDAEAGEGDEDESAAGLGRSAEPFVHEGKNKRPPHPTMRWLMKQLEKRDVGTGATRTSTYSEVTNQRASHPLLVEKGKKVTLTKAGRMSWLLLPGTRIGDLGLTEQVYADMREIAAGSADPDERLARVAGWVEDDIARMQRNAGDMRAALDLKATPPVSRAEGVWAKAPGGPRQVAFKRVWSGREFTDEEVERLLAGEEITFEAVSARTGNTFTATGSLQAQTYQGRKYVGFAMRDMDRPTQWCKRVFTPEEVAALEAGRKLEITDFVSKNGKPFGATISWDAKKKKIVPEFGDEDSPPTSWCQHVFTEEERQALAAGKQIFVEGFVSSGGRTFDTKVRWGTEAGRRKIIPAFKD